MQAFIIKRLLTLFPTLLFTSIIVFGDAFRDLLDPQMRGKQ
jgi:ABC-type dipeptide/oligopeptide/nickel transport system permease component